MRRMNFQRSRAQQLADHLRGQIRRRQLSEPLPSARVWSSHLGVSRPTLETALRQLGREGLLSVTPRGTRLCQHPPVPQPGASSRRVVRILYPGRDFPESHSFMSWVAPLSDQLHLHSIHLTVEKCSDTKLRLVAKAPDRPDELIFLLGMPMRHQRMFQRPRKSVLLLGEPGPGVALPFLTDDQDGAVRHATQRLLRRGFSRITLLLPRVTSPGILSAIAVFRSACLDWPRQPVQSLVIPVPLVLETMRRTALAMAGQIRAARGIIVVAPIPVGLIMTALLQRGLSIPGDAEIVAVFHGREALQLCPAPVLYSPSVHRCVTSLVRAARCYFETGRVPVFRKRFVVEPV